MATLYACVFQSAAEVALGDPIQEFATVIGSSSTQSDTITSDSRKRRRVRLFADADCFVTWGENPTALQDGTEGRPVGSENPEYVDIESGHKLAVIERV